MLHRDGWLLNKICLYLRDALLRCNVSGVIRLTIEQRFHMHMQIHCTYSHVRYWCVLGSTTYHKRCYTSMNWTKKTKKWNGKMQKRNLFVTLICGLWKSVDRYFRPLVKIYVTSRSTRGRPHKVYKSLSGGRAESVRLFVWLNTLISEDISANKVLNE